MRTVHGDTDKQCRPARTGSCRAREDVVARITALLEARGNEPLHLTDLCRAVRVSERTLRAIFHDVFGIGPGKYLRVRRLELIRVALIMANPAQETVAAIAARHGFSDGGRMARDYFLLFGEYPSATLARPVMIAQA